MDYVQKFYQLIIFVRISHAFQKKIVPSVLFRITFSYFFLFFFKAEEINKDSVSVILGLEQLLKILYKTDS